jgi:hypothetical protein
MRGARLFTSFLLFSFPTFAIGSAVAQAGPYSPTPPLSAWDNISGALGRASASYAVIDPVMQVAELTASDGSFNDFLGTSVAVAGNTVVVGPASDNGPFHGAAYVFVKPTTGWNNMTQTAELTASDGMSDDELGRSVSISVDGNTIVSGAPFHTNADNSLGAVYVWVKPATGWTNATETAKLTASDGSQYYEYLGLSVSISADAVVVGAPGWGTQNVSGEGALYVYVKPQSGWVSATETARLTVAGAGAADDLGESLGISGSTIVGGAPGASATYVFVEPAGGWSTTSTPSAKLSATGTGGAVAINGGTIAAGSPNLTVGSNHEQGAAFIFIKPPSGWRSTSNFNAELTASNGATGDQFGSSVTVAGQGNGVVSGAIGSNATLGSAYLFLKPKSGWKTTSKFAAEFVASDGQSGYSFGSAVNTDGRTLLVGSPGWFGPFGDQQGAAYVFGR